MANPYDFTSGFLAAKQLQDQKAYRDEAIRLQREEMQLKAPYLEALARNANASAGHTDAQAAGLRSQNELTNRTLELVNPIFDKLLKRRSAIGINSAPLDFSSITRGYTTGFKPNYSLTGDSSSSGSTDASTPEGVVVTPVTPTPLIEGKEFSDGTPGGLRVPSLQPPPSEPAPVSSGPSSGIEMLAERNPGLANSITRNMFDMSNKEFQQLSGALSLVDFARGKMTSSQLVDHVENLRKVQAEGVMRAAQAALSGNEKKAIDLYHEYGDDTDSVVGMKKIQIANPVPGAAKKTKDSYDGVLVTLKDGSTLTLDPRRLALDIIGTKATMDHDEKVASSIRTTDANVYHTDVQAESNRLNRQLRGDQLEEQDRQRRLKQISDEAMADIRGRRNAFLDNKNPNFIADEQQRAIASDRIDAEAQQAATIAQANVNFLGNKQVSYLSTLQAIKANRAVMQDGKPVTKVANGVTYVMTPYNVWIPAPQAVQPPQQ